MSQGVLCAERASNLTPARVCAGVRLDDGFRGFEVARYWSMSNNLLISDVVCGAVLSVVRHGAAVDYRVRTGLATVVTAVAITAPAVTVVITTDRQTGEGCHEQAKCKSYRDSIRPHRLNYTTTLRVMTHALRRSFMCGGAGKIIASPHASRRGIVKGGPER
jgi:hypothetical protein